MRPFLPLLGALLSTTAFGGDVSLVCSPSDLSSSSALVAHDFDLESTPKLYLRDGDLRWSFQLVPLAVSSDGVKVAQVVARGSKVDGRGRSGRELVVERREVKLYPGGEKQRFEFTSPRGQGPVHLTVANGPRLKLDVQSASNRVVRRRRGELAGLDRKETELRSRERALRLEERELRLRQRGVRLKQQREEMEEVGD